MAKMERHIGFQVKMLSKQIKKCVDNTYLGDGGVELTGMQRWMVHYIYMHPDEEIYQKDIEKIFGIRRSSATEVLKALENMGMITRTPLERDARLKKIVLTDKAVNMQRRIEEILDGVESKIVEGFTPQEVARLKELLSRCIANIGEDKTENADDRHGQNIFDNIKGVNE